jgi:tetratricopeptide (TPR) repeat protein
MIVKLVSIIVLMLLLLGLFNCDIKGTAEQRYNMGINHAADGEIETAKEEFQKALKLDKSYQPAKESLEVIEYAIKKKLKDKAVIYFFRAVANSNERKFNEVISLLGHAISLEPSFYSAYYERGLALAYMGDYNAAIIDFSKTIALNPRDAAAFNNRGLAFAKGKKQYDEALSDFNKAIEINPRFAEAYDNRGIAYRIKNDDKRHACDDWKKACELNKCDSYYLAQKNGYCE